MADPYNPWYHIFLGIGLRTVLRDVYFSNLNLYLNNNKHLLMANKQHVRCLVQEIIEELKVFILMQ
jgi:hypothetical protein